MVFQEIRQSVRGLIHVPSLTAISILTVTLGVGGGTALFSVVKAVLLNPLPYKDPEHLVWLAEVNAYGRQTQVAYQNFLDWQAQSTSFSAMAAYEGGPAIVAGGDVPQSTHGTAVTRDFFTVMRVEAAMGRTFSPDEQKPGQSPVVVIGYSLWQTAFGGSPDIVGRTIRVLGTSPTVVGVMPPGFDYPDQTGFWMPATTFGDAGNGVRTGHNWRLVGRLKPETSLQVAQGQISGIERRIKAQFPSPFQSVDAAVMTLQAHEVGQVRQPLLMLFGAGGFVLLIVCVNVANLLLVRVTARTRELSIRTALGANSRVLTRQMLIESLLLAFFGGACGLLLAASSMDLIRILLPADMPRAENIRIDAGVIAFAIAISALTGLLFGLLPAWRASRLSISDALKAGSRSISTGKRSHRTQAALVISEACLSLVLVAGAGLLARSFLNLSSVDPGFQAKHVLKVDTQFQRARGVNLVPKYRELLEQTDAIPGVEVAAIVRNLPLDSGSGDGHFYIESRRGEAPSADAIYNVITPGYFDAMRIPLLRGRGFSDQDTETSEPVVIISSDLAKIYFPDRDPIGQRIWFDSFQQKEQWVKIVGIVGDVRQTGLGQRVFPQAYTNFAQQPNGLLLSGGTLVVRARENPSVLIPEVRRTVLKVNPDGAPSPKPMTAVLATSISKQRFQLQILGGFAFLALLLAGVGLYGVLSHLVAANRFEIGIRLALGASGMLVFRMIVGRALQLAAVGIAAGVLGCVALRRVVSSLLFGVGASDPVILMAAGGVLLLAAFSAAWLPARRATKIDPIMTLRSE